MMKYEFCCPTLFGLEGIVGDELRYGGKLKDVCVENGRVFFTGDESTLVWANLWLRCAERVLLKVGECSAATFSELFDGVYEMPWHDFIPQNGAFPIKGYSLQSALHSIPDCQSIIKKAVAKSLSESYGTEWFEESGARYQIQFAIKNDIAELFLDTSGAGLHKRGYRAQSNAAPLRETLAAAMVKLSRFKGRGEFLDPFCGSGTIPIEAALIASNRAPGLNRSFDAEQWDWMASSQWAQAREEAQAAIRTEEFHILGSDIDPDCVGLSITNARKAGVGDLVWFTKADACTLKLNQREGTLICNPPYGERLMDQRSAQELIRKFGTVAGQSPMKQYIISSDEEFERFYGFKADKKRKLYNGMIRCNLHIYYQPPEKRTSFCAKQMPKKSFGNGGKRRLHRGK